MVYANDDCGACPSSCLLQPPTALLPRATGRLRHLPVQARHRPAHWHCTTTCKGFPIHPYLSTRTQHPPHRQTVHTLKLHATFRRNLLSHTQPLQRLYPKFPAPNFLWRGTCCPTLEILGMNRRLLFCFASEWAATAIGHDWVGRGCAAGGGWAGVPRAGASEERERAEQGGGRVRVRDNYL